jgi:aspartyl-tRNA(Asn)/glutamyl-tRNA(Gln) amidotransferase subunit A
MDTRTKIEYLLNGKISPEENLEEKLKLIKSKDSEINAFITITEDYAKNQIKELNKGKLFGLVIGIKDNFCVKDVKTTCASKTLENYVPDYTATVVNRLFSEGCIMVGKLNMDEFACGSSGETSYFGPTRNPLDLERVPGGSSSGCGAAIAADFCDITLGSDTGGSIRCPAAFCGCVGYVFDNTTTFLFKLLAFKAALNPAAPLPIISISINPKTPLTHALFFVFLFVLLLEVLTLFLIVLVHNQIVLQEVFLSLFLLELFYFLFSLLQLLSYYHQNS